MFGAAPLLAECALDPNAVRVGSKNFTESFVIAEIYAQALERAGMRVRRLFNLGSTQIAMAAMRRGNLDCYPEYTGTALIDVLHDAPIADPRSGVRNGTRRIRAAFRHGVATAVADERFPRARDDASHSRTPGTAHRLRRRARCRDICAWRRFKSFSPGPTDCRDCSASYGGFHFAETRTYDIALKYRALLDGKADVATAFTTDGAIATNDLLVLRETGTFGRRTTSRRWFAVTRCSRVRQSRARSTPSPRQSPTRRSQDECAHRSDGEDPADVAAAFLSSRHGHRSARA